MALRIAIASIGRFHLLDLARELHALGHEVRFYSYVPKRRAVRFGLPPEAYVGLLAWVLPLVGLQRLLGSRGPRILERIMLPLLDLIVRFKLKPCDVFIGMSGAYLVAARFAKKKFGAKVLLERGSRHILSQLEILSSTPGARMPSAFIVRREIRGYEMADGICVPSRHARDSFLEVSFPRSKLIVNPYGVDLSMFTPRTGAEPVYDLAFVGTWSLQKGADLLVQAMEGRHWSLIHVGSRGDVAFPSSDRSISMGPVDQAELPNYYRKARILVLPSRQDGFGLVLSQALACGVPIVCTDRTGGPDLRDAIEVKDAVIIVPAGDAMALANGIEKALEGSARMRGRDLLGREGRAFLSWGAYARRSEAALLRLLEVAC